MERRSSKKKSHYTSNHFQRMLFSYFSSASCSSCCVVLQIAGVADVFFPGLAEGVEPISWATRMNVAVGIARGLSFLHRLDANVIFRDLKSSNILLDSVSEKCILLIGPRRKD